MYNYTAPGLALRTHLSDTRHCTAQLPSLQRQHKYNYNVRKYRYNAWKYNYNARTYNYNAINTDTLQGNTDTMQEIQIQSREIQIQYRKENDQIWLRLGLVKKVALDLTYFLLE